MRWRLAAALAAATAATFHGVARLPFIRLDDPDYVTANAHVLAGLGRASAAWALVALDAGNWHPVTWLSHLLDVTLFGVDPVGHHLVNLALHCANAALLFVLLERLTGAAWRSALAAALFALHPLRVESVAWVAERKDLLAGFFWLAATLAYAAWTRAPGARRFAATAALFALGLASKPILVTLPFTLLLLDAWPLGRLDLGRPSLREAWPRVREKLPLFAMSAASSAATLLAQSRGGAVQTLTRVPLVDRLAHAPVALVAYLGKTLWPASLAVFYPYPAEPPGAAAVLGCAAGLVAATALAWRARRRFPWAIVGWLWFLGTLVPVLGLVQVGMQAMADRYTYVPGIGLAVMAAWSIPGPRPGRTGPRIASALPAGALLLALALASARQVRSWTTELGLFQHAAAATERNWLAESIVAGDLERTGDLAGAREHYQRALAYRPLFPEALNGLGAVLYRAGETAQALELFREAVRQGPENASATSNLGAALVAAGRLDEGLPLLRRAAALAPADAVVRYNLAGGLLQAGRSGEALAEFEVAARLDPRDAAARAQIERLRAAGPR